MRVATVTLVVRDYDEALRFYCDALGFSVAEDATLGGDKRWVVIEAGDKGARLLLARADGEAQMAAVGNQAGGRVAFFLETDNFARDHAAFASRGVLFLEVPRYESYGTVAVFVDLYGNKWDLIEPKAKTT